MSKFLTALLLCTSTLSFAGQYTETDYISAYQPGKFLMSLNDLKNDQRNGWQAVSGIIDIDVNLPYKGEGSDAYYTQISRHCSLKLNDPIVNPGGYRLRTRLTFEPEYIVEYFYNTPKYALLFQDDSYTTVNDWIPYVEIQIRNNDLVDEIRCEFNALSDELGDIVLGDKKWHGSEEDGWWVNYVKEGELSDIRRCGHSYIDSQPNPNFTHQTYIAKFRTKKYFKEVTQRDLSRLLGNQAILKFKYRIRNY